MNVPSIQVVVSEIVPNPDAHPPNFLMPFYNRRRAKWYETPDAAYWKLKREAQSCC